MSRYHERRHVSVTAKVIDVAPIREIAHVGLKAFCDGAVRPCRGRGEALGVQVELTQVRLKYPGLTPWEIWLSEAQERVVIAVPPEHLPRLQALADLWEVEVSVLGHFTGDGKLDVRYAGKPVAQLPMEFLHNGIPRRHLIAIWQEPPSSPESGDYYGQRCLATTDC